MAHAAFEYDVFLSHNSLDKPKVRRIAERLHGAGLKVWFDEYVIQPGDDIFIAIEQGLKVSRCLLLCMSRTAFNCDWVKLESSTALFRDPVNRTRRFVPLLLDDCHIPDTIKRFLYIDARRITSNTIRKILTACCENEAAPKPVVDFEADNWPIRIHIHGNQTHNWTRQIDLDWSVINLTSEHIALSKLQLQIVEIEPIAEFAVKKPGAPFQPIVYELHLEPLVGTVSITSERFMYNPRERDDFRLKLSSQPGWKYLLRILANARNLEDGEKYVVASESVEITFPRAA